MIRRLICFLSGHRWGLTGNPERETYHYRCARCGKTQTYYF